MRSGVECRGAGPLVRVRGSFRPFSLSLSLREPSAGLLVRPLSPPSFPRSPWATSSSTGATRGSSGRAPAPAGSAPTATASSASTASTCAASASGSTPRTSASSSWIERSSAETAAESWPWKDQPVEVVHSCVIYEGT